MRHSLHLCVFASNKSPVFFGIAFIILLYSNSIISTVRSQNSSPTPSGIWAEIRVIDSVTGRGIPLVELETVNALRFVTDNAGRVAFHEPGLMGREIFFNVRSHGYEAQKDAFGISGAKVTPRAGQISVIKLTRRNVAERLCRLTGEGLYRDSVLLGYKPPLPDPLNPGQVGGQDSIQAAIYRDHVYWFWGDTSRMNYPLGLFRMAGATTPVPDVKAPASDPASGIAYEYFVDKSGFTRAMMPLKERPEGVVWVGAVFVVADDDGTEKLLGHYSRRKGLEGEYEQGIAAYNVKDEIFEPARQLPLSEMWRHPSGHPIVYEEGGVKWLLFGSPTPNVRVPATLKDVLDPAKYEAFTCARADGDKTEPDISPDGKPRWRWQKELPPTDSKTEQQWVKDGKLKPEDARFYPADSANPHDRVILHSGSVRWNAYRKRWVLLAGQIFGKPSMLGEVWYAESAHPTGPFSKAVKVITHDRQTFYNVCHHSFLDRDGGRVIHFEGTYTNTFSGNPDRTPRYDYNQVLYRLNLDAEALRSVRAE
jgi:hypothetical protein